MPTYKFVHTLSWSVSEDYWETFDTDDQGKWDELLELASESGNKKKYPKKAPKDPNVWFDLYSSLSESDLENQDEENPGDYIEHDYALFDEDDSQIC